MEYCFAYMKLFRCRTKKFPFKTFWIDALERAIIDYLKVAKHTSFPFINTSSEASLNIPAAVAGGLAAFTAGLSAVPALLVGAAAGIEFGPSASLKHHKANPTPFLYISSFHKRVF